MGQAFEGSAWLGEGLEQRRLAFKLMQRRGKETVVFERSPLRYHVVDHAIGMAVNIQSRPEDIPPKLSIEAFFDWAETRDRRYELVDGVPRLLPWVKRNHNRIAINIVTTLARQIDNAAFEIAIGDFAVTTGPASVRYADVMVEVAGGAGEERTADKAIVLVEILSPSTAHVDFGPKLQEYLSLATLDTYLIIGQDERSAWQWTREADGNWPEKPLRLSDPEAEIVINTVGAKLRFADIYRNIT
jgi:Uma2 family endonuclease